MSPFFKVTLNLVPYLYPSGWQDSQSQPFRGVEWEGLAFPKLVQEFRKPYTDGKHGPGTFLSYPRSQGASLLMASTPLVPT